MSRVEPKRRMPWLVGEVLRVLRQDGRSLLAGLPALFAGAVMLAVAVRVATASEDRIISRYLVEADRRAQAGDLEGSVACLDRLLQTRADWPELRYEKARVLLKESERDRDKKELDKAKDEQVQALVMLNLLAPEDRPGYTPAQLTLAKILAESGIRSEATYKQVEQHLKHAYSGSGPESLEAAVLLGNLYAQTPGKAGQAETYLLKAVDRRPELLITLANLADIQNKKGVARERAEHAIAVFQKEAEQGVDQPLARLQWAQATLLLKDDPRAVGRAIDILERGVKLSGYPGYGPALAKLYALQEYQLRQKGPAGYGLRLIPALEGAGGLPKEGKALIVVAAVKNVLHFRVFDAGGTMVVDTDETKLTTQAGPVEQLRKQLAGLWPPHEASDDEKGQVITAVTSVVGAPVTDCLALLERGLSYDASNRDLLARLSNVLMTGDPGASERARSALKDALTDGEVSAGAHCALGMDAGLRASLLAPLAEAHPWSRSRGFDLGECLLDAERARWEGEARNHWEQAFRLNRSLEVVANNLAWLLAHDPQPDLNRALDLANQAIAGNPSAAHYHGTRGVILMKLGKWSEALTDLEAELKHSPANKQLHLSLAEVYDRLGDPEMAGRHRARAEGKGKGAG